MRPPHDCRQASFSVDVRLSFYELDCSVLTLMSWILQTIPMVKLFCKDYEITEKSVHSLRQVFKTLVSVVPCPWTQVQLFHHWSAWVNQCFLCCVKKMCMFIKIGLHVYLSLAFIWYWVNIIHLLAKLAVLSDVRELSEYVIISHGNYIKVFSPVFHFISPIKKTHTILTWFIIVSERSN